MSIAYVFLATGFEETEAVGTIDILRRGGVNTKVISITDDFHVEGAHGITIMADSLLSDVDFSKADALVLPGGMPGTLNLRQSKLLCDALIKHFNNGKIVAAICAAPSIFGDLSIADGKNITCYPGFENHLAKSNYTSSCSESDGNVITGRAPGTVFNFALSLLESLEGKEAASSVANDLTTAKSLGY